jgi:hypothetical protein
MAFFNTKDVGPVVIDVPPANGGSLNGNSVNVWQMPLEDAGLLGADTGQGGKYLILPPGYADPTPQGYIPLQSDTFGGYALLRSNLHSHNDADVEQSIAYGKRVKVYPLSQADNPPATVFTDAKDVLFDSTIRYDASFFDGLNRVVQSDPWLQRDRAMIDQLKSLGIEKGKPSAPIPRPRSCLQPVRATLRRGWRQSMTPVCHPISPTAAIGPSRHRPRWSKPGRTLTPTQTLTQLMREV